MRTRPVLVIIVPAVLVAAVLVLFLARDPAMASHGGSARALSIDLDATGNSATSLGPQDNCREVRPGEVITVDVTAADIPEYYPIVGFAYDVLYEDSAMTIETEDARFLLAANPLSSVFDVSDLTPDEVIDGRWTGTALDIGVGIPEFGSGVLSRLTISAKAGGVPGRYPLVLANAATIDSVADSWVPDGFGHAYIAIDAECDGQIDPGIIPNAESEQPHLGFDHDGAPPIVDSGPARIPTGGSRNIPLISHTIPGNQLAEWDVTVSWDTSVLVLEGCDVAENTAACQVDIAGRSARISGSAPAGEAVDGRLADLIWRAVGSPGACTSLLLEVSAFSNEAGSSIVPAVRNGRVCLDSVCSPVANDQIGFARPIGAVPFTDTLDVSCASPSISDPVCFGRGPTVWYTFVSATSQTVQIDATGDFDTTLSVFAGTPDQLTRVACVDDDPNTEYVVPPARITFDALAGRTYYVMAGAFNDQRGGLLTLSVGPASVPLVLDVSIEPVAAFIPRGAVAVVDGTITCSKPAFVEMEVLLVQHVREHLQPAGSYTTGVWCEGEVGYSAPITAEDGRFKRGQANALTEVLSDDYSGSAHDVTSSFVQLEKSR